MRWMRDVLARRTRDDRGAVIVFMAVILVMLIGMVAFAIDVSALYEERRELQSGADAAVLAIAEDCVRGEPCDDATANATANDYADLNAKDGSAGIFEVDLDSDTVFVTAETEEPNGTTVFAPFFAQVIGFDGTTVRARAEALYGYAGSAEALPLIVSECEWDEVEALELDNPSDDITLFFHDAHTGEEDDCNAQPGHDWDNDSTLKGGFGWLDTGGGTCAITLANDDVVFADPGASPSTGCDPATLRQYIVDKGYKILIPWFVDAVNGSNPGGTEGLGAGGKYYVENFMAFHVTGYNFGGKYKEDFVGQGIPCAGQLRCIRGYRTEILDPDAGVGGDNRGALVVRLTK